MDQNNSIHSTPEYSLPLQLTILTLSRLILNISLRMVYLFTPAFARGLGVPVAVIFRLITIRNLSGLLGPLFSPSVERYGYRLALVFGMTLFAASSLFLFFVPTLVVFGVVLVLLSLAKVIFDPAMQAYIGNSVPYPYRGRAISATELSWAGGLFIGGPFIGWVIAQQGWQAPFLWLGLLAVLTAVCLWVLISKPVATAAKSGSLIQIAQMWRKYPVIRAASFYYFLLMAANEVIFIQIGTWMEAEFNLTLTALGITGTVIGSAELGGEFFAGWSVDKFGKRRIILITGTMAAIFYLLTPLLTVSLTSLLVMLFLMFLFFEITIVGGIPLMTELVPSNRAIVMALVMAFAGLGRASGSFIGPLVWQLVGFLGNGVLAMVLMLTAVFILYGTIPEEGED